MMVVGEKEEYNKLGGFVRCKSNTQGEDRLPEYSFQTPGFPHSRTRADYTCIVFFFFMMMGILIVVQVREDAARGVVRGCEVEQRANVSGAQVSLPPSTTAVLKLVVQVYV